FHLFLFVRRAVTPENIMEPQRRLVCVGFRPTVPRIDGLRLTVYKPPVKHGYVVFFGNWQETFERTAVGACHILGAPQRLIVPLELLYTLFEILGRIVIMETDDIRLLDLQFFDWF